MADLAPPSLLAATTVKFQAKNFVSQRRGKLKDTYQIGELLGSGGYGDVFVGRHKRTGQERAIKVVVKSDWDEKANESVLHEFEVVKDLDHPNILKMYELFEDDERYYIVTDIYRGGELFSEIEKYGYFSEDDTALLMNHVLSCINFLHKRNLVHRDLKPENILLEANMKLDDIKVIDFGLAYEYKGVPITDGAGSSYYMSPECYRDRYGPPADIWSCGVIAYITMVGYAPFDGEDDDQIKERVLKGDFDFNDEAWDGVSDDALDFIDMLLIYDPDKRPTAEEALEHPWLRRVREGTNQLLLTNSQAAKTALTNLMSFRAQNKLQQAAYAIIASQLLEKHEKEEIDEVFRAIDLDCDGKIDTKEVKNGFSLYCGKNLSDDEIEALVKRIDIGGTGHIEYSEFAVAAMLRKDLLDDKKLVAVFGLLDKDGDGKINSDDIIKTLGGIVDDKTLSNLDEYVKNKILKQVESFGGGALSFSDFKNMMMAPPDEPPKKPSRPSLLDDDDDLAEMGELSIEAEIEPPMAPLRSRSGRIISKPANSGKPRVTRKTTKLPVHSKRPEIIAVQNRRQSQPELATIAEAIKETTTKKTYFDENSTHSTVRKSSGSLLDD